MNILDRGLGTRRVPTAAEHVRWRFFEHHLPGIALTLLVLMLVVTLLFPAVVQNVPSGHVGLLWKRFGGTVLDPSRLRGEGIHLIFPWDILYIYDLRLQTASETYNAISEDGVNLNASITIRFRLNRESVPLLHEAVGPEYLRLLILPEAGNRVRQVIAKHTAEQVYATQRITIQDEMYALTQAGLSQAIRFPNQPGNYVLLHDLLVLGMELPPAVIAAINRKIDQYYIAQEYVFRVARERLEKERKQIEAEGIRDFQTVVSTGISESYLRWRGIEATLQLAQSQNSKVVLIGGGKDGLPIILGNVDGSAPAPPFPGIRPASASPSGAVLPHPDAAKAAPSSPAAVSSEIQQAASPVGANVPDEKMHPANLATPSTATPDVSHAFVPPHGPARVPGTTSDAVHPLASQKVPPQTVPLEGPLEQPSR